MTASRVEAVFDVGASASLNRDQQRATARAKYGERVTAVAQDARSQARNRELALERLRDKLAAGLAVPKQAAAHETVEGSEGEAARVQAA